LGITEPGVWYTAYGEAEQILVSGMTETKELMLSMLQSNEWDRLQDKLVDLVSNYSQKILPASGGFQL
jgi:hypothetical protein